MKRTVACVLSIMLILLTLSGCSSSDEALLVGRWTVQADRGVAVETMLGTADPSLTGHIDIGEFKVDMILEFRENGTYAWTLDEEQLKTGTKAMMDAIAEGLRVYLQIETGMNAEDLLRATGYTMDELMGQFFDPDMASVVQANLASTGTYALKDGKLVLTNAEKLVIYEGSYSVSDTTLKLTGGHCEELLANLMPMNFKRK